MIEEKIYNYYLNKIEISKLSRDFLKYPLQKINGIYEKPTKQDLEYLFLELNLPFSFLNQYFQRDAFCFTKFYGLSKTKELYSVCRKQTNLLRYGVTNPSKSEEIKKKKELTCLEHFGVTNSMKTPEIVNKLKQTNLKRYGVDNYSKSKMFKEKYEQTCLEKYGVTSINSLVDKKENVYRLV